MKKEGLDWDFVSANTKEHTHGFHTYPAMMIPQIARQLIKIHGKNARTLLDPFMGSGTSLVEVSITHNIEKAYGFDLNPLAVLISKVKTTSLNSIVLNKELSKILKNISKENYTTPKFHNVDFWFKKKVIRDLSRLKAKIKKIKNEGIRNFFLIVFSETIRNVSNTRNREFKLYRMDEKNLKKHNPETFKEFEKISRRNIDLLKEYVKEKNGVEIKIDLGNSSIGLPLEKSSIDLIVTSPPYGDSRTTVAYGQFSRLALQWMDYKEANMVDKKLLGGIISKNLTTKIKSPKLRKVINKISKKDTKRAKEILSFYEDFNFCVKEIDRVMKKNGKVCFVVGNRTIKKITLPTDKIMIEMFQSIGNYKHLTTYKRKIPHKRMPKSNSPTNKKGDLVPTINEEYIFILKKL
jgi:site-specific DNA-methyltransferase (cytosine-N4-specific)